MPMRWTIEYIDKVKDRAEAEEVLSAMMAQSGYLGGRILTPSPAKPGWRVQTFFDNEGIIEGWLPDGCHYRLTPLSLLR